MNKSHFKKIVYISIAIPVIAALSYLLKGRYDVYNFEISEKDKIVIYHESAFGDGDVEWKYDIYVNGKLAAAKKKMGSYRRSIRFSGSLHGNTYKVRRAGKEIMRFDTQMKSLRLSL